MPETPSSHQLQIPPERSGRWRRDPDGARDALARTIPRRAGVSWWLGLVLAIAFAAIVTPAITAERWLFGFHHGSFAEKQPAPFTVRAPMLAGYDNLRVGGGVVVTHGELATRDEAAIADAIADAMPRGPSLYIALFALTLVLAAIFTHHMRRSNKGRLVRVQVVSLAIVAALAVVAKAMMLVTALSALVVPVAVLAMIPTLVLDRIVGLATGVLAALVVSLLAPFDVGLAILLLVQAASAGLVIAERPKRRWVPALTAGLVATVCTGATYVLLTYLTTGHPPELRDPLHAAWLAAAVGPAVAAVVAVPLTPLYQLAVGEITQGKLFALEDLSHPLLRQIAERSPGTWQHSLMMANMAEIAANAVGASGRLVRVGAYYHDLGKSLSPKYFIENLEAGETSPHDQLPPEVSCDAIFAHVTEGIAAARRAGLHERIIDFMHMHHGNGVLEYFWARCREQGNPHGYTIEQFRYPGHPPQSRETAILTICDAVEAASRTLKKPDAASIDALVQRIVYGKLHLGQLDESGLSMADLRRISDSLRETIRHANHARIEYPWQKAEQDASASTSATPPSSTAPRLDSLDRKPGRDSAKRPRVPSRPNDVEDALAATADVKRPASPADSDAARIRAGTARNTDAREADTVGLGPKPAPPPAAIDAAIDTTAPAALVGREPASAGEPSPAAAPSAAAPSAAAPAAGVRAAVPPAAAPAAVPPAAAPAAAAPEAVPSAAAPSAVPPAAAPAAAARSAAAPSAAASSADAPSAAASSADASSADASSADAPSAAARSTAAPAAVPSTAAPRTATPSSATVPAPDVVGAAPRMEPAARAVAELVVNASRPIAATLPGRAPGPAPSDLITPATFVEPAPEARTRAATLPPAQPSQRAATLPPAQPSPRPPTMPPPIAARRPEPVRTAGPPEPVDLDSATTNPPPLRRTPSGAPLPPQDPAQIAAALAAIVARVSDAPFGAAPRPARDSDGEAAVTSPAPREQLATQPSIPIQTGHEAVIAPPLPPAAPAQPSIRSQLATQPSIPIQLPPAEPLASSSLSAQLAAAVPPDAEAAVTQPAFPALPASPVRPRASTANDGFSEPAAPASDTDRRARPAGASDTGPHLRPATASDTGQHPRPATASDTGRHPRAGTASDTGSHPKPRRSPSAPMRAVEDAPWAVPRLPSDVDQVVTIRRASAAPPASLGDDDQRVTAPHTAAEEHSFADLDPAWSAARDPGVTEPSLPALAISDERRAPRRATPPSAPPRRRAEWSSGLAARIDARIDSDEWGRETPVAPPSRAELRALTGNPDPTRQIPIHEIERLQREAVELAEPEPPRRAPHPTAEVDPDDIEAAIELAPPARRPHINAIGAKPKKRE